jgi:hypothetical protein
MRGIGIAAAFDGGGITSVSVFWRRCRRRWRWAATSGSTEGWRVWHDVPADYGNFDHIVLGPAGLFVLDSKLLRGELYVERDGVRVRRRLADDEYGAERLAPAVTSRAMQLRAHLREATRFTEYVQAAVVIWSPFPQTHASSGHCVFLAGDRLVDWLLEQPPRCAPPMPPGWRPPLRTSLSARTDRPPERTARARSLHQLFA